MIQQLDICKNIVGNVKADQYYSYNSHITIQLRCGEAQTKNEADLCGQLECEAGDFYDQLRSTASQKLTDVNALADIFVNIHQYVDVSRGT